MTKFEPQKIGEIFQKIKKNSQIFIRVIIF
jgi:hypothetical protein